MKLPLGYVSGLSSLLLLASALFLGACSGDDDAATGVPIDEQIDTFIADNNLTDVQRTSSGLVYVILEPGGPERPTVADDITINYRAYLTDGRTFDETSGTPRTFPLGNLIRAWQEAIPLIGRGGEILILAPPSIAYGQNPPRGTGITSNSVLVFDIELVDFQ